MPRPQQNNADYFSHDNNMRSHRKVKILRNKFGQVLGYAFWNIILEYLTGMDGTEFEYSELEFEILAAEIGEVSAAEIKNMVDYALKIELLFKSSDEFIYSESLNERLSPVFEKRRRERQKSKVRQRREDGKFNDEENEESAKKTTSGGVSAAEIPQSKVKESKVYTVSKDTVVENSSNLPTEPKKPEKKISEWIRTFEKRKKIFGLSLADYVKTDKNPNAYPPEIIRAFFNYWTEPNKSGSKMRWELERTWKIGQRLSTWDRKEPLPHRNNNLPEVVTYQPPERLYQS